LTPPKSLMWEADWIPNRNSRSSNPSKKIGASPPGS
jgi:hypothetical protein